MRYLSWLLSFFRWTQRRGCIDEIVEHCCTVIQNGVLVTATVTKAKMDKIVQILFFIHIGLNKNMIYDYRINNKFINYDNNSSPVYKYQV